ncbi:MAG: dihydrofolate reductase [Bacteroidales bacterium]|nr:dihydrofolate reductase [Bacteroidales bacterium]
MKKCLIVAVSENLAIGRGGTMPWHISEDLKFFKRKTMGCPVIMGRRTYESIGRPLPGRLNIVVSRTFQAPEGVVSVSSLDEAYAEAQKALDAQKRPNGKVFVMGGGQLYAAALDTMDRLYITRVKATIPDADTFFPEFMDKWVESHGKTVVDEKSGLVVRFSTMYRK